MAFQNKDRVRDTSTTQGTGPFVLAGSQLQNFQLFSTACIVGDTIVAAVVNRSANEWMVGLATYSAPNQLTFIATNIYASSLGPGHLINFSSGIKDVFNTVPAQNDYGRILLFGDSTFFVSTTGSDVTGNGSQANPWRNIDFAAGFLSSNYDAGGFKITLQMADGTYDSTYPLGVPNCNGFTFQGNTSDQSKVIINTDGYSAIDFIGGLSQGFACNYITFNMLGGCAAIENDGQFLSWSLDNCSFTGSGTQYVHTYGAFNNIAIGFNQGGGPGMKIAGSVSNGAFEVQNYCQFFTIGTWTIVGPQSCAYWYLLNTNTAMLDQVGAVGSYVNPTNMTLTSGFAFNISGNSGLFVALGILPGSTSIYPRGQLFSQATFGNGADPNDNRVGGQRFLLTADKTFFVRPDGNDANTGVANNANGAFKTFAACFAFIVGALDFGGHNVTISMQAGVTWTAPCIMNGSQTGGGTITLNVNGGTIAVTTGGLPCIQVANNQNLVNVGNFNLSNTVAGGLDAGSISNVATFGTNSVGAVAAGTGKYAADASAILFCGDTSLTFSVNGNFCIISNGAGAQLYFYPGALVLTGTPAFSRAFALAQGLAYMEAFQTNTITTGTATGPRYEASLNAVIQTFGSGANNFPGNVAGSQPTGGQYA